MVVGVMALSCGGGGNTNPAAGLVHVTITGHGGVSLDGSVSAASCDRETPCISDVEVTRGTYTLLIEADDGWELASATFDGVAIESGYEFEATEDQTLDVVFVPQGPQVEVAVSISGHGTVSIGDEDVTCAEASCTDTVSVDEGAVLAVSGTAAPTWARQSLQVGGVDHPNDTDYTFAAATTVSAVFTMPSLVCTPTSTAASPPSVTFVNPNGGGCAGQILFIGGSSLGGDGTCVVVDETSLPLEAGAGNDVIRVALPPGMSPGIHTFTISTLAGSTTVDVFVASGDAAVPTAMSPNPIAQGAALTITGTNLGAVSEVRYVGAASPNTCAITARSETSVTCTTPAQAGSFTVHAANGCGGADVPGGPLVVTPP